MRKHFLTDTKWKGDRQESHSTFNFVDYLQQTLSVRNCYCTHLPIGQNPLVMDAICGSYDHMETDLTPLHCGMELSFGKKVFKCHFLFKYFVKKSSYFLKRLYQNNRQPLELHSSKYFEHTASVTTESSCTYQQEFCWQIISSCLNDLQVEAQIVSKMVNIL